MKKFLKIFLYIVLFVLVLGIVFYMIDSMRVQSGENPIFTFHHKIVDGLDYSAKIDSGLGYKIIRYDILGQEEIVKIGTIFMDETPPTIELDLDLSNISGDTVSVESGEDIENVKVTTFGEKYKDTVMLEGFEEEVDAKTINSKLGYSMMYYYDLFEYTGFEDHDLYLWHLSSGDDKSTLTIYDVSNEAAYKEALDKIEEEKLFEQLSGDYAPEVKKLYYRAFEQEEVQMVNYIYLIDLNNLKLMVDLYYRQEAEEGIGVYMHKMAGTISDL